MKLPSPMRLVELAHFLEAEVQSPADVYVESIATSPLAASENDLAFVFEKALLKQIDKCKAKALIVPKGTQIDRPAIFVTRPPYAIYKMLSAFPIKRYLPEKGVHPSAIIDPSVELGSDIAIGPLVVIGPKSRIGNRTTIMANTVIGGEVLVGEDCLIHPGCMIADYVQIGTRVILQQGASIGSDGFGYVCARPSNMELRKNGIKELSKEPNPLLKIPQVGTVIIEDEVEIGSNATIDRATIGVTKIGKGTKIDNLVMVAHNCQIGKEAIIVSQVGIAGSCTVGDRALIAGQVGLKDHIKIGNDVIIEGQAGVMKNIDDEDVQCGSPAQPARDFMTMVALNRRLPNLFDQVKEAQKTIEELQKKIQELEKNGFSSLEKVKTKG